LSITVPVRMLRIVVIVLFVAYGTRGSTSSFDERLVEFPPLPITCFNVSGQDLTDSACGLHIINYILDYTGAGNFYGPSNYNANIIPVIACNKCKHVRAM